MENWSLFHLIESQIDLVQADRNPRLKHYKIFSPIVVFLIRKLTHSLLKYLIWSVDVIWPKTICIIMNWGSTRLVILRSRVRLPWAFEILYSFFPSLFFLPFLFWLFLHNKSSSVLNQVPQRRCISMKWCEKLKPIRKIPSWAAWGKAGLISSDWDLIF